MSRSGDERLHLACRASPLPAEVMQDLEAAFRVSYLPPDAAPEATPAADALLVTVDSPLNSAAIGKLPGSIRALATYSVGLDHLDLSAAADRGLVVLNTPRVLAESVADAAMLLVLATARRLTESLALVRSGEWEGWTACQLNGLELAGKTMGVFGMGEIGRAVAHRARAFGMRIAYSNRSRLAAEFEADASYFENPLDLLGAVDLVVLAAPSTAETRGFLQADSLAAAKPGIIVVNVGRGDLVVDEDLIAALQSGRVGAAGLDVMNNEPKFDPRYLELPNVVLLPHIGSSTLDARRRMARCLIDGLQAWRAGRRPDNQVP